MNNKLNVSLAKLLIVTLLSLSLAGCGNPFAGKPVSGSQKEVPEASISEGQTEISEASVSKSQEEVPEASVSEGQTEISDVSVSKSQADLSSASVSGTAGPAQKAPESSTSSAGATAGSAAVAAGTGDPAPEKEESSDSYSIESLIRDYLAQLSLEDKVSGLFVLTPEALTGYGSVTEAGDVTRDALAKYPVAGLIYFQGSIQSREQVMQLLENTAEYGDLTLEKKGASVSRSSSASEVFSASEGSSASEDSSASDSSASAAKADVSGAAANQDAESAGQTSGEAGVESSGAAGSAETVPENSAIESSGAAGSAQAVSFPIFLAVDEEGGVVSRIGQSPIDVPYVGPMGETGVSGDPEKAFEAGDTIGEYLHELGFNLDFAPDADVLIDPNNQTIGDRSFGTDPELCGQMVHRFIDGLHENGVSACIKHFPGLGDTETDTHTGGAWSSRSLEDYSGAEFLSFHGGIEAGTDMVMISHLTNEALTGSDLPASLNRTLITGILREKLNYDGVVITDSLQMGAVSERFDSAGAAVLALDAGADLLLMPMDFESARQGILDAVQDGRLTEERIDESLRRILLARYRTGLRAQGNE